jgi:mannose-6-phosphate isomerase
VISSDRLYPYVLAPKETAAIWGGDTLVTRFGKHADPKATIGESWECWDENTVVNGELAGAKLGDLRAQLGAQLMGPIDATRIFPVLTKFIDARQALSVQVHPDDSYAQRVEHQPNGKTECWYILEAQPDAELVLGWTRDMNRAEYETRVADGTLGDVLRRVPVKPGDAFYLPAGTLHAIGAGIVLFETQQASDLTYRIFDWNRVGNDGKPRELHVAKAADVLDFRATSPGAVRQLAFDDGGATRTLLIADRRFLVEHVRIGAAGARFMTDGLPVTITALATPLRIEANGSSADVPAYGSIVAPALAQTIVVMPARGDAAEALVVRPQPNLQTARAAAANAGVAQDDLEAFFKQFE